MSSSGLFVQSKRSRSSSPASDTFDSPTKRTRVDEEIEQMLQVPEDRGASAGDVPQHTFSGQAIRDDTYYMQDGSCVLQVEDTLFNVGS